MLLIPNHLKNASPSEVYDELNKQALVRSGMFDDATGLIFARQLTHVIAKTLETKHDDLILPQIVPISTEGGAGLTEMIQVMHDKVGSGNIISGESTDIPSSDVEGAEHGEPVHMWATHVKITYRDMIRAGRVGLPVEAMKRNAASYVANKFLEDTAASRSRVAKIHGLRGFFSDLSLLTPYVLPADGTGSKKAFATKDYTKINRDLKAMLTAQLTATQSANNVTGDESNEMRFFQPDTILCTPETALALQTTEPTTATGSASPLQWLRKNTSIKNVIGWPALRGAVNGKSAMLMLKRTPEIAEFKLPSPLMALPVQYVDLVYKIFFVQDVGGLHLNYPYSILYALED